jgi:hypothetical protein
VVVDLLEVDLALCDDGLADLEREVSDGVPSSHLDGLLLALPTQLIGEGARTLWMNQSRGEEPEFGQTVAHLSGSAVQFFQTIE